jgi:hypothetical protein
MQLRIKCSLEGWSYLVGYAAAIGRERVMQLDMSGFDIHLRYKLLIL